MEQSWICETCGQLIRTPKDGWVEWTLVGTGSSEYKVRDIRIVHFRPASPRGPEGNCQFDQSQEWENGKATIADSSLEEWVGPDGLMNFLEHAARPEFKGIDMMEMLKRVQVPGYDRAKSFFNKALAEGVIELRGPEGFYSQAEIRSVLEHYGL